MDQIQQFCWEEICRTKGHKHLASSLLSLFSSLSIVFRFYCRHDVLYFYLVLTLYGLRSSNEEIGFYWQWRATVEWIGWIYSNRFVRINFCFDFCFCFASLSYCHFSTRSLRRLDTFEKRFCFARGDFPCILVDHYKHVLSLLKCTDHPFWDERNRPKSQSDTTTCTCSNYCLSTTSFGEF